jgi:ribosomal protein S15P/S13E
VLRLLTKPGQKASGDLKISKTAALAMQKKRAVLRLEMVSAQQDLPMENQQDLHTENQQEVQAANLNMEVQQKLPAFQKINQKDRANPVSLHKAATNRQNLKRMLKQARTLAPAEADLMIPLEVEANRNQKMLLVTEEKEAQNLILPGQAADLQGKLKAELAKQALKAKSGALEAKALSKIVIIEKANLKANQIKSAGKKLWQTL